MFVIDYRRKQFVGIGKGRDSCLANVETARRHVEQVIDHAALTKALPARSKSTPQGLLVPSATTSNFLARGMKTRHGSRHDDRWLVQLLRINYL
jgi:hypothetical protein